MHYWKNVSLVPGHDLQVLYIRNVDRNQLRYFWPFVARIKDSMRDAAAEVCK